MSKQEKEEMTILNNKIVKNIKEINNMEKSTDVSKEEIEQLRKETAELAKQYIELSKKYIESEKNRLLQKENSKLAKLAQARLKCTNNEEYAIVDAEIQKVENNIKDIQGFENQYMEKVAKNLQKGGIEPKDVGINVENEKANKKSGNFIVRFFTALFGMFKKPERKTIFKQSAKEGIKTLKDLIDSTLNSVNIDSILEGATELTNAISEEDIKENIKRKAKNEVEYDEYTFAENEEEKAQAAKNNTQNADSKDNNKDKTKQQKDSNVKDSDENKPQIDEIEKRIRLDFKAYFQEVEKGYEDLLPREYKNYKIGIINEYINPEDKKAYQEYEEQGQNGFENIYKQKKGLLDYCYDAKDALEAEKEKYENELKKCEAEKEKYEEKNNKKAATIKQKEIIKLNKEINKKNKELISLKKAIKDINVRKKEIKENEQKDNQEEQTQSQEPVKQEPAKPDYKAIKQKMECELMAYFNEINISYQDILPQEYYDEISVIVKETINNSNMVNKYKENGLQSLLPDAESNNIISWMVKVTKRINDEIDNCLSVKEEGFETTLRNLEKKYDAIKNAIPEVQKRYIENEKNEKNENENPRFSEEDIIKNKIHLTLYENFNRVHEGYMDLLPDAYNEWYATYVNNVMNDSNIVKLIKEKGIEYLEEKLQNYNTEEEKFSSIVDFCDSCTKDYEEEKNDLASSSIKDMSKAIKQRYEEIINKKQHEDGKNDGYDENEYDEEGEYPPINDIINAKFDIKTAKYTIKDAKGNTIEHNFDKKLLNKKAQTSLAVELMDTYAEKSKFEDVTMDIETAKALSKKMDINLYRAYQEYDEKYNTYLAPNYIDAMRYMNVPAPSKMTYDLRTRGGKVNTPFLSKGEIKKIAKIQEDFELAKVERDPKLTLGQKIAISLGIAGATATIGVGAYGISNMNNQKDLNSNNNIEHTDANYKEENEVSTAVVESENKKTTSTNKREEFKNSIKANGVEQSAKVLEEKVKEQIENQIGIGSKAILNEGTYYYDSEGNGPTGKMENRENKEVTITLIATVKDGKFENCLVKDGQTIGDAKQLGDNTKIMVQIKNEEYDLGWISFDEVKDAFVDYVQQQKEEAVK